MKDVAQPKSLIELTNFCNGEGYDLFPIKGTVTEIIDGKKTIIPTVRCIVFKNDKKLKEGDKIFRCWMECQKESYQKIYDALTL